MANEQLSALSAECTTCGAVVPVVLASASPPCRHCGSQNPIAPEVEAQIAPIRARLGQQSAREQPLVGRQAEAANFYDVSSLFAFSVLWILFFALGWLWTSGNLPESIGSLEVFFSEKRYTDIDIRLHYYLHWAMFTGYGLMLVAYGITMIRMRRLVRFALPRRPLSPGRPPRCRICGAELGEEGRLRRCAYCRADHVIRGEAYQREDTRLEAELTRVEEQLDTTLKDRERSADKLLGPLTGCVPLMVMFCAPAASFLLPHTDRVWTSLPVGLLLLGLLLVLVGRAMPVPEIRTRHFVRPGDTLLVDDRRARVVACASMGRLITFPAQLLFIAAPNDPNAPLEAIFVESDGEPCRRLELEAGGAPLTPAAMASAIAAGAISPKSWHHLDCRLEANGSRLPPEASDLWYFRPSSRTPTTNGHVSSILFDARIWFGDSPNKRTDPTPAYTIRAVHHLASDKVWLVQ
ncbi:MAG: hypothetical protein VB934_19515 [Polyangiaceae bacterium]